MRNRKIAFTYYRQFLIIASCTLLLTCSPAKEKVEINLDQATWGKIESSARATEVNFMMWVGDPFINRYINNYVVPEVKARFGVEMNILSGQGGDIVALTVAQQQSGGTGEVDMVWINGETFYQLRQLTALYGPFTDKLPSSEFVDWENPFIGTDFQQPVEGYEAPWGNVQLALIYNDEKVLNPPKNRTELAEWVKQNPGKFTFATEFTGLTFLKSLLIDIAGGGDALAGDFDQDKYDKYAAELWEYINGIKPYFWKNGETFPETVAQMHQMFANTELWFTLSNNDGEVDNKIAQGLFDDNSRAYVLESGTIQNSHYLGIMNNSANKAGAMTVINFMMSPEAQLKKMQPDVWGDGTILSMDKLPQDWKEKFESIPGRTRSPKRNEIQKLALMEIAPEYMIKLNEDFRKFVIEN
ncbi:MAG: putative spermidine/putrescine transport system substrate-binding protein [Roseivirga sp.]|jgi:putative spermidine/putrescine transport system substrate-binding protein